MMNPNAWPMLLTLLASLGGGVILGLLYFRAVRVSADLIVTGTRPVFAIALTLARLGFLGAGFALALQAGGLAVLAALVGILGGRELVIHRVGSIGV